MGISDSINAGKDDRTEIIEKMIDTLHGYDINDFISRVSALNLLPSNQNKCAVFDEIIDAILQCKKDEFVLQNRMSQTKFKQILNAFFEPQKIFMDPPEMPFVYRVLFYGNRWIFSGMCSHPGYDLQAFIDTIFIKKNNFDENFKRICSLLLEVVLRISTHIVTTLKYDINVTEYIQNENIDYSDSQKVNFLVDVITFDCSEYEKIIGKSEFEKFYAKFECDKNDCIGGIDNYYFFYHPFFKISSERFIVLDPSILASFLINQIIILADEYQIRKDLLNSYNEYIWGSCQNYLLNLGHQKIKEKELGIELLHESSYKEILLNVCNDGLLLVNFFCDNGEEYRTTAMFDMQYIDLDKYERRKKYIESKLVPNLKADKLYYLQIFNTYGQSLVAPFLEKNMKSVSFSAFDLMCISINESNNANSLIHFIDRKSCLSLFNLPYIRDIHYLSMYVEYGYSFYFDDNIDMRKTVFMPDLGAPLKYYNKALQKEDRQLAPYPCSNYYKEIVFNDKQRNIYCCKNSKKLELLNRFSNIDIWVSSCEATCVEMLDINYSIIDLISFWLSEFKGIIENSEFSTSSIIIKNVLEGEISDYSLYASKNNDSLTSIVKVKIEKDTICIFWKPSAFVNMGINNEYERELMLLIIGSMNSFSNSKIDLTLITEKFTNPLKRKSFTLDYENEIYFKPIDRKYRKISTEFEDVLLDKIGEYFAKLSDVSKGKIHNNNEKAKLCNQVVGFLYQELKTFIKPFSSKSFYEVIYYDLEKTIFSLMLFEKRYAYNIACYPELSEKFSDDFFELNKSSTALKFLMEFISAEQPDGETIIGELDYEYLLAVCSLIVEWAHCGDLFYYNIISPKVELLDSGRIGFNKKSIQRLASIQYKSSNKMLYGNSDPFIQNSKSTKFNIDLSKELDEAFEEEFSYTKTQFVNCVLALIDIGEKKILDDVKRMNRHDVVICLNQATCIDSDILEKIINDLSLQKRNNYLDPPHQYSKNDVYPWKNNRRLSFNRRPIIVHNDDLIWGSRQLYHSLVFLFDLIMDGKLYASKPKLKKLIGKIANSRGNGFNDIVATKLREIDNLIIDSKVKKINGLRIEDINKNTLGDIDVLLINLKRNKIIVAEVKDFSYSKNPYEMHREYMNIFCNDEDGHLCYIAKHKKRVNWIREHIDDVVAHYRLPKGKWKVDDVLIVSEAIISNDFYSKGQKILLFSEINEQRIMKI